MPYEEMKNVILEVNEKVLTENMVQVGKSWSQENMSRTQENYVKKKKERNIAS